MQAVSRTRRLLPRRGWFGLGTIALQSVGCKLNQAETESLTRSFLESGYQVVSPELAADVYLLNTCTVTHIADGKCRKLLRAAHRRNPQALIVVTGCYAERARAELEGIEGVGLIIGNRDKARLLGVVSARSQGNKDCGQWDESQRPVLRTRALVKIQDGCSQPCAYCIVPRVRGQERSRPQGEVIAEIKARVAEGYSEVILTGTRIGSYSDGEGLPGLVRGVLLETDVLRLRLSSLEPPDLTPELIGLWENDRLCSHIHLPLQSGCDSVLEHMGRAYSSAGFEQAVSLAREAIPNLALTTDIMVGFPGESDEEFAESYRFCERIGFARLHVFPYSARPGTRAARMSDRVEQSAKRERSQMMLALAEKSAQSFRQRFLGQSMQVLWEGKKEGIWVGLSDNYVKVFLPSPEPLGNRLLVTKPVAEHKDGLWGEIEEKTFHQTFRG